MLLEFSVKNYLSFRDKVTLSMVASSDDSLPENTMPVPGSSKLRVVKSAGLYGANASGKSNLIKAMQFMCNMVLNSARGQSADPIRVAPFKLDAATANAPSEFEITFMVGEDRYVYGFIVDQERVHEEWLTVARTKPALLFQRNPDGSVEFGRTWRGDRKRLADATRPNALLLSVADQSNVPAAKPAYRWFSLSMNSVHDRPEAGAEATFTCRLLQNDRARGAVTALVGLADPSIADLDVQRTTPDAHPFWSQLPEALRAYVPEEVFTTRVVRRYGDGEVAFDLDAEESEGTRRLFALAAPWLHTLRMGWTLLVDEIERKLHPHLTRALVRMVHEADTGAQLIFTTHDCGLLDGDLLRRDQIWFTEKDSDGATDLYSLWDFRPRQDVNLRKGYLNGRYGAIPFIGELPFGKEAEGEAEAAGEGAGDAG